MDEKKSRTVKTKLRSGKKDNSLTKKDVKRLANAKRRSRKQIYRHFFAETSVRKQVIKNEEDNNCGTEALGTGLGTAAGVREGILYKAKVNHYSNKIYKKHHKKQVAEEDAQKKTGSNPKSREQQKSRLKREMQEAVRKRSEKAAANETGSFSRKAVDRMEDLAGKMAEFVYEHPMEILLAMAMALLLLLICAGLSSCSMIGGAVQDVSVQTSYTAQDTDILAVEADYQELEADMQERVDNIENDYPGYDEYRYTLAEINHNPYQLAAILTVLYEDYTENEVQAMLETLFDAQYSLTCTRVVEQRSREESRTGTRTIINSDGTIGTETYTYTVTVYYDYYILQTTLTNATLDAVVNNLGFTEDQMSRYELLMETYGNKRELFGDNIYAIVDSGDYVDYDIPTEYLTDTEFANMIQEAERYLGYPYVWGGSSPSTSFDCSGFVSYVINHCGNGWNVGRQTADGLRGCCTCFTDSSLAEPGDLIFFQGTYQTSGASHVGIYVGNGMMIHAGNPIQYASVNTNYWQGHFLCYGRIN